MAQNPLLLSVRQAAGYIGLSESNCWRMIGRGELKSVKVDGRRYVPVQDAEAFVERLRHERDAA